ncbi:MAG TPA: cell envelope biogenesis protein TolA [Serratia grimesii]|jgi:colicin import membrane protein|uniref:Cell envelope biogenesis protein TolA n=1 Tax=Serratia grimesii TaxID=82995 RepID=A0A9C7R0G9_9GAMM|nr:cell envelope integrity TolA C-terminal domain-containing protein [Serratia grimesii]HCK02533.1 cell envelope biogenesis protein TolA [Serratia grimesii]
MKTGMWLLAVLLTGCGADQGSRTGGVGLETQTVATSSASSPRGSYPERMRVAVTQEMQLPGKYKSQTCSISLHLLPDGSLKDFKVLRGDEALCAAASQAVQRAKLPKMANETEYALFNRVVLDFMP